MKRKYGVFAGIAALGMVAYIASHLWPGHFPLRTVQGKMTVVNLLKVMKNYEKFKVYETNLEQVVKKFSQREEGLRRKASSRPRAIFRPAREIKRTWGGKKLKEGGRLRGPGHGIQKGNGQASGGGHGHPLPGSGRHGQASCRGQ